MSEEAVFAIGELLEIISYLGYAFSPLHRVL